ncbi:MAG: hypothetical protein WKG01_36150 [Kofleriaceae bacterium]
MGVVLVHIDLDGGVPHPSSLTALAAGRAVASSWGAILYAGFVVSAPAASEGVTRVLTTKIPGIAATQQMLARSGADKLVVALTPAPVVALWAAVGSAWQGVLDHLRPRLVLFGADAPSANELGPRTGAKIGARLLGRAHAIAGELVELRDRDGGSVRATDGGAAVALVGTAQRGEACSDEIQVLALAVPGGADPRIELAGISAAERLHASATLIALGDEAAADPAVVAAAAQLAYRLGATLIGNAGSLKGLALVPELCIAVGAPAIDLAGSASLVRIGTAGGKGVDGALTGPLATSLDNLCRALEDA